MTLNLKQRIAAISSGLIILTAAIVYFVIFPTVRDIQNLSDEIYEQRVDLEKKYQRGQLLRQTVEDFRKLEPNKEKLDAVFFTKDSELELITTLEEIASRNRAQASLRIQKSFGLRHGLEVLPISLNIQADFPQLLTYLQDLESLPFYLTIGKLRISSAGTEIRPGAVTASLDGQVYILTDQELGG